MKRFLCAIVLLGCVVIALPAQAASVECTCEQEGLGSCDSTFISEAFIVCVQADAHKDLEGCVPTGLRGQIQCLDQGNINIDNWGPEDVDDPGQIETEEEASSQQESAVGTGRGVLKNPLAGRTVPGLIGQTVAWLGTFGGAIFFLYLLWGGVEWMTAGGDQAKVKSAQQRIVASVAGIAVILFSYLFVASIIGIVPQ